MRIRKRFAPALSDLQLQRSEAAPPSDQSMAIQSKNKRWVFSVNDKIEGKMKQKEFGDDETWVMEAKKSINDDIRKIVNYICNGEEGTNKIIQPSCSSAQEGSWCEGENKVVPLKKRKGSFERNPKEERIILMSANMKSKTNKKCDDDHNMQDDQKTLTGENGVMNYNSSKKKGKRGTVIMEDSRCSRINGRGWRCRQPTLVGYSLCKHHSGKGRLRSMANGAPPPEQSGGSGGGAPPPLMVTTKKRTKVGVVKARSLSSLLSQI